MKNRIQYINIVQGSTPVVYHIQVEVEFMDISEYDREPIRKRDEIIVVLYLSHFKKSSMMNTTDIPQNKGRQPLFGSYITHIIIFSFYLGLDTYILQYM